MVVKKVRVVVKNENGCKKVRVDVKGNGEIKVMLGCSRGGGKRDVHLHQG